MLPDFIAYNLCFLEVYIHKSSGVTTLESLKVV